MPEEPFIVLALAIVAGTFFAVVKAVLGYLSSKHQVPSGKLGAGSSLTTSELESMIRRAVDEANAPMRRRLEVLEAIVTDPEERAQLSPRQAGLLDELEELDAADPVVAKRRVMG
ncbi:MAG TPA: hypothetical protein VKP65_05370 [Rhodothermales bacterium]|nr:hypothetical protein [Rhodothermales bacterium]